MPNPASPQTLVRRAAGRMPPASAWVFVLAVGLVLFEAIRRAFLATHNPRLLPAMVLFGTVLVPVTFLSFVWGRQVHHDVSPVTAITVGTVGGCLSVAVSAILENAAFRGSTFGPHGELPSPIVGILEEGTKLLVTMVLLIRVVPRTPLNGLLVGVATGTGFAVLETLGYAFVAYLQQDGGIAALDADLVIRSLFTPATHIAWAGLTGCAYGYAASRRWRPAPVLVAVIVFTAVAAVHTVWDQDSGLGTYLPLTALDLTLLAVAVKVSGGASTGSVTRS